MKFKDSTITTTTTTTTTKTYPFVSRLGEGTQIGPTQNFYHSALFGLRVQADEGPVGRTSGWADGARGIVGFRFTISPEHYGWAGVRLDPSDLQVTLFDWAFQSEAGTPIRAGDTGVTAVPEPSPLMLLAVGAAAVRRFRRTRA